MVVAFSSLEIEIGIEIEIACSWSDQDYAQTNVREFIHAETEVHASPAIHQNLEMYRHSADTFDLSCG